MRAIRPHSPGTRGGARPDDDDRRPANARRSSTRLRGAGVRHAHQQLPRPERPRSAVYRLGDAGVRRLDERRHGRQKAYFSHTDSLGRDPWTRMCYFGYCYNTWKGENIAAGYVTAAGRLQRLEELARSQRQHARRELQRDGHRAAVHRRAAPTAGTGRTTSAA